MKLALFILKATCGAVVCFSKITFVVMPQQPIFYNTELNAANYRERKKQPGVFKTLLHFFFF